MISRHDVQYARACAQLDEVQALFAANEEIRGHHTTSRPAQDPRWAVARTHYEDAAQVLQAVRDHRGHTWVTLGLADMALYEGDHTAAELIRRALQETDAWGAMRPGRSSTWSDSYSQDPAHRGCDRSCPPSACFGGAMVGASRNYREAQSNRSPATSTKFSNSSGTRGVPGCR